MATTNNQSSLLHQLRRLMPRRPLTRAEAFRIAELQASRLLQLHGIDQPGVPTELLTELPYIQAVVRTDAPEAVSGGTVWIRPRWLIVLSAADCPERLRFSLFHEFKHILDHGQAETIYAKAGSERSLHLAEQVADYFAACALMPRRLVKRVWGQRHQDLDELAVQFGVSRQAMQYRIDQLKLTEPRPRCGYRHSTASFTSSASGSHPLAATSVFELAA